MKQILMMIAALVGFAEVAVADAAAWHRSDQATVRVAFAEDCDDLLLHGIASARKEITIAAYSFTRNSIADALIKQKEKGVLVSVKMDSRQAKSKYCAPIVKKLRAAEISIELIKMPTYRAQHNKFMVVDRKMVMTGSFNFSAAAEDNWENLVRIDSVSTSARFLREWKRIESR